MSFAGLSPGQFPIPPGSVEFHPVNEEQMQQSLHPPKAKHHSTECGSCGKPCSVRVVASVKKANGDKILWCLCPCEMELPMTVLDRSDGTQTRSPLPREFHSNANWPSDLAKLFDEASGAYSAGAFTAAAMTARKVLMACAVNEGDGDGKPFAAYVDYVTNTVLTFPKARTAIDAIRKIGNDANHKIAFVNQADAHRAMSIVKYMLDTIYALPTA